MNRLLIITGVIAAALSVVVLTGFADADDAVKQAARAGNAEFDAAAYGEALNAYAAGLDVNPEDETLGFNAAQAAYALELYDLSAALYAGSGVSEDMYLGLGAACYRFGDASEDYDEKLEYFLYALQAYYDGIEKYPENMELKFNFEFLSELIEFTQDESQENEPSDENEENEEGEEGDQSESENGENDDQDSDEQEGEQSETSEDEDNEDDIQEAADDEDEEDEEEQSREEIERILSILEDQEEESLKNNREIQGGRRDGNGW